MPNLPGVPRLGWRWSSILRKRVGGSRCQNRGAHAALQEIAAIHRNLLVGRGSWLVRSQLTVPDYTLASKRGRPSLLAEVRMPSHLRTFSYKEVFSSIVVPGPNEPK